MLDRLIRRYASEALAVPATKIVAIGMRAQPLALAGLVAGFAAVPFIAHSAYLTGLSLILAGGLLYLLALAVSRLVPATADAELLARTLTLLWSASVPFGFALAEPERSLAAMFLMLGLVARAAVVTADAPSPPGIAGEVSEFGADLVGTSELAVVYAALCLFPHWFSIAAYALGIACFVMTGFRVAKFGSQRT